MARDVAQEQPDVASLKEWIQHLDTFLWELSTALIDREAPQNIRVDAVAARRKFRENTENL